MPCPLLAMPEYIVSDSSRPERHALLIGLREAAMPCSSSLDGYRASSEASSAGVRVDTWVETGTTISPHYDSLIAKLMVYASSRQEAIQAMQAALSVTRVSGLGAACHANAASSASP